MTEGISKETLLSINPWDYDNQQDLLNAILELCKELDPWLPIDEDTPKHQELILKKYSTNKVWIGIINHNCYAAEAPTHYKILK